MDVRKTDHLNMSTGVVDEEDDVEPLMMNEPDPGAEFRALTVAVRVRGDALKPFEKAPPIDKLMGFSPAASRPGHLLRKLPCRPWCDPDRVARRSLQLRLASSLSSSLSIRSKISRTVPSMNSP
jgi:hypothetical protein